MKAGRITVATRNFEVKEVPTPTAQSGQVRIKVGAAGVCLSDVHFLDGTLKPGYLKSDEVTLGHEVAGTLGFDYDGGYAEYVIAKQSLVVKIPDNLPFEQAAIIPDAVSTPWAAISTTARIKSGESVAVFGVGGLGIHAVQLLKLLGCSKVIAIDPRSDARDKALEIGADLAFDPGDEALKRHRGLNACFDFAGVTAVRKQALSLLGEEGRLMIVGIANEPITIPNDMAFTYMRTQVLGHYGSERHHTEELVQLARDGKLDLSKSVSEILPLSQAELALEKLEKKIGNPIRIVLKP
jgi:D-arabinose 1-dehydrogenase-like Zn-dependent alcohol dehydrogenase